MKPKCNTSIGPILALCSPNSWNIVPWSGWDLARVNILKYGEKNFQLIPISCWGPESSQGEDPGAAGLLGSIASKEDSLFPSRAEATCNWFLRLSQPPSPPAKSTPGRQERDLPVLPYQTLCFCARRCGGFGGRTVQIPSRKAISVLQVGWERNK